MFYKPFKPPLIRKAPESSEEKVSAAETGGGGGGSGDEATPPAKKQRLGEVDGERKPLGQVKNSESVVEDSPEKYFNALWYGLLITVWLKLCLRLYTGANSQPRRIKRGMGMG